MEESGGIIIFHFLFNNNVNESEIENTSNKVSMGIQFRSSRLIYKLWLWCIHWFSVCVCVFFRFKMETFRIPWHLIRTVLFNDFMQVERKSKMNAWLIENEMKYTKPLVALIRRGKESLYSFDSFWVGKKRTNRKLNVENNPVDGIVFLLKHFFFNRNWSRFFLHFCIKFVRYDHENTFPLLYLWFWSRKYSKRNQMAGKGAWIFFFHGVFESFFIQETLSTFWYDPSGVCRRICLFIIQWTQKADIIANPNKQSNIKKNI